MPLDVDGMSFAELVAAAATLNDQITAKVAGYNAWAAGAANGGPGADGRFPLPVLGAPGSVLVPSPAKIAADAAPFVVGLFADIAARQIPAAVKLIQTSGQSAVGRGAKVLAQTANVGEKAWRTQSADGRWWETTDQVPALWDFGWSAVDCGPAILAAFEWAGTTGRSLLVPPGTFKYVDRLAMPAHLTLQGVGFESVLMGPGLKGWGSAVDGDGKVTYEMRDHTVRDLRMDGTGTEGTLGVYNDGNTGLDFLGCNFVHVEHVQFYGFKHQLALDVVQRGVVRRSQFQASAKTMTGVFIPGGPEAHAGVSISAHPTNIVEISGNHFTFGANTAGYPIADHGGHQRQIFGNQSSNGRCHYRVGGISDVHVRSNDWEFSQVWAIEAVATNFAGAALSTTNGTINVGPDNYCDKPSYVSGTRMLVVIGDDYFIPGQAAFQGCAGVRSIRSFGAKNNRTAGTIFDADPAFDDGASIVQFDEQGLSPRNRVSFLQVLGGSWLEDLVSGVVGKLKWEKGFALLRGYRDAVETLRIAPLEGYIRPGTTGGLGGRIYSGSAVPDNTTVPGAPSDGTAFYLQTLTSGAYAGDWLIWLKDAGGTWRQLFRPRSYNVADLSSVPPTEGRQIWVHDRLRPAWGNGTVWKFADGTTVS